jgi:hypothetical protein
MQVTEEFITELFRKNNWIFLEIENFGHASLCYPSKDVQYQVSGIKELHILESSPCCQSNKTN